MIFLNSALWLCSIECNLKGHLIACSVDVCNSILRIPCHLPWAAKLSSILKFRLLSASSNSEGVAVRCLRWWIHFWSFQSLKPLWGQKWGSLKNHHGHFSSEFQVNFEGPTKMSPVICGSPTSIGLASWSSCSINGLSVIEVKGMKSRLILNPSSDGDSCK